MEPPIRHCGENKQHRDSAPKIPFLGVHHGLDDANLELISIGVNLYQRWITSSPFSLRRFSLIKF